MTRHRSIVQMLSEPVDIASTVVLRFLLGLMAAISCAILLVAPNVLQGFLTSPVRFSYPAFEWLPTLSLTTARVIALPMFFVALVMASGLFYRASALLLAIVFTYFFLLDEAYYTGPAYAACLLYWILLFIPLGRSARTIPRGAVWLLQFQVGVIYVFAALAKLDDDWWPAARWG